MLDVQNTEQEALILDKEWERIQIKTFTAWTNSYLRRRGVQIKDILKDLRDGRNLAILLEVISNERLPPPEKGRLRVHHISNINKCLKFVADKGVKLVGVGSEEIVDGNEKMTLGMIWTIILRFSLQGIEEGMSAKDGLLLWCQRKTKPYSNVNVNNFTTSWSNGLALCALIHRHRPELIDYDQLTPENKKSNLEYAFKVAEESLDIPKMLDPEDVMLDYPDEKSIMTYVSCFYKAFSTSHELESAIKRLQKALDQHAEYEKNREEYETLASELVEWIKKTTPEMEDRNITDDNCDSFNDLLKEFTSYRSDVKPKWSEEKHHIQSTLNTLQTLLRANKHPQYSPPEHLNMAIINELWNKLGEEERKRLEWIKMNLKRHRSIEHLVKKFNYKCNIVEEFIDSNKNVLTIDDTNVDGLINLYARKRLHESLTSELESRTKRLSLIDDVYMQLQELNYCKINECTDRFDKIKSNLENFKSECDNFTKLLDERIEVAKTLDTLRLDYCKESNNFKNLCDSLLEDADDAYIVDNVADVKKLQEEHQKYLDSLIEIKTYLDKSTELDEKIKAISSSPNPYTSLTVEQMLDNYNKLLSLGGTKTNTLADDLVIQLHNEEINNKLKVLSEQIIDWQTNEKSKTSDLTGSLEEQKEQLKTINNEVVSYHESKLIELKEIVSEINENNTGADRSMVNSVESGYHELIAIISSAENAIDNQILIRDSSSLTEEQLAEIKQVFNKLDKFKLNYLNHDDFRNFLVAMGFKITPGDPECDKEFTTILNKCDHNNTGHVTLSSYLNYLAESTESKDSHADMIQSFKVLADGKPYITVDKLKAELPNHVERCVANMKPYTGPDAVPGALDYLSYSENLYSGSDL